MANITLRPFTSRRQKAAAHMQGAAHYAQSRSDARASDSSNRIKAIQSNSRKVLPVQPPSVLLSLHQTEHTVLHHDHHDGGYGFGHYRGRRR